MEKKAKKVKKPWSNRKRFIVFICIFAVLLTFVSEVMTVSDNISLANIKGFYKEEKNSIDVAFIGPSEFYADYSPTQAWSEFGYTSYSLACSGVSGALYKSMLTEYLKTQSPKLVVFELNGFIHNDAYYDKVTKLHTWIDNIPWSKNKVDTIRELVPKDEQYSYFFKLASSHSNWTSPLSCAKSAYVRLAMDLKKTSYSKGFSTYSRIKPIGKCKKENVYFGAKGEEYLRDLLQYCKDQGLENVLFVRTPHAKKVKNQETLDKIQEIIESYGYDFVNMNNNFDETGIDTKKDFYNKEHLNVNGMTKFTSYLGKYLCDHYPIVTEHSKEQKEHWDMCAEKTAAYIEQCKKDIKAKKNKHYWEIMIK